MKALALIILIAAPVHATTFTAADCERATINTIIANDINAGSGGDTLVVPPGSCTWTAALTTFTKSVTLKGYGALITVSAVNKFIDLGTTANSTVEGFKFVLTGDSPAGTNMIFLQGQGFKIVRNIFINQLTGSNSSNNSIQIQGGTSVAHPTGVVAYNTFYKCRVLVFGNAGIPGNPGALPEPWSLTSSIGNADQTGVVYVENNWFDRADATHNAIDSQYGGRYVFRYNTVVNMNTEMHSINGNERGGRSAEIYKNNFSATVAMSHVFFQRAGEGVIWGNVIAGTNYAADGFKFDNIRSYTNTGTSGCCDGNSSWDANTADEEGWPCRDQIGRGKDNAAWPDAGQASSPYYEWDNTRNGANLDPTVVNTGSTCKTGGSSADIVAGRDYIVDTERPSYRTYTYPYPGLGTAEQQRPNVRKRGGL